MSEMKFWSSPVTSCRRQHSARQTCNCRTSTPVMCSFIAIQNVTCNFCVLVQCYPSPEVNVTWHCAGFDTLIVTSGMHCADACREVDVCIFFVGSSMIKTHEQAGPADMYTMWSGTTEGEGFDRSHIKLPGSQEEIIKVMPSSCTSVLGLRLYTSTEALPW